MSSESEKCGLRVKLGFGPTLVCEREPGHDGAHYDLSTYPHITVAFGGGMLSMTPHPVAPPAPPLRS